MTIPLPSKIVAVHEALSAAEVPHAFGGALALAWCTQRARGTIDIDVNIFLPPEGTDDLLAALPDQVDHTQDDRQALVDHGQTRLWWDRTPIDVFLDTTPFHRDVGTRVRLEPFGDAVLPFLACRDLAVFKAFFDRTKDWADLEEMQAAGSLDIEAVAGVLVRYLGGDDHRIARLLTLG
ncbi:hypothetical protein [Ilumatobacter sp.]|uniref:hypothetical protein n=1 Tax=Ilumatobacter sp. TaxID=1967498 RepID=UPI003C5A44F2